MDSQLRVGALPQENEFTEAVLGGLLADELEAEMKARIPTSDCGVPQRLDEYWYYWYRGVGQQYKVHARSVPCLSACRASTKIVQLWAGACYMVLGASRGTIAHLASSAARRMCRHV